MSRYYRVITLLDLITKIESDLVLHTEYHSLSIIPAIQHLFDRHCFYNNDTRLWVNAIRDAEDMLLEFDIEEGAVLDAVAELDREIAAAIHAVTPFNYSYNITHRYLNNYSFLLEIYQYDSVRETLPRKCTFLNNNGGQCVYAIPAISAYGS